MTSSDAKDEKTDRRGFEALAVVLLSLATVGTAWCAAQASAWSSRATELSIQSVARGRDATSFRIKASQAFTLDIFLYTQYLNAHNASNEPLADFYARRFSPELKQAYEAQTRWANVPNAPTDPFVKDVYQTPLLTTADTLEAESERMWNQGLDAGKTGHRYTLISVLLATALFFSGTAPHFQTTKKRYIVLTIGLATLLVSVGIFIALPRPKGEWGASFRPAPAVNR